MEERVQEVLYETHYHASRPFPSDFPPQQPHEGVKGRLLSLVSARGLNQLKDKWNEYKHPRKLKKWISLFISPRGEHVAIAIGNQITILQKDDNYKEPCGIFTSAMLCTFIHGTWSDSCDILGVTDDNETLYFIKANGEEITKFTKRQLKVSLPIIGLIVLGDSCSKSSCLCSFNVLTSEGLLHNIEFSQELAVTVSSKGTSSTGSYLKKQFPQHVSCADYHQELSLLVLVCSAVSELVNSSNAGLYSLSLWHRTRNSDLEPVFSSPQFEGLYSPCKGYAGPLTTPKVVISPQGKFVATVDMTGSLFIFKLENEFRSLSVVAFGERNGSHVDNDFSNQRKYLNNIVDFTWWSDHILIIAKRSGVVTMLDVIGGIKLLNNDPVFSKPVLERIQQRQGFVFLLENASSDELNSEVSQGHKHSVDLQYLEQFSQERSSELRLARSHWDLLSFSEISAPEMYTLLISNQQYQAAMDFANRYGLDKDEVYKSQWLHSNQGTEEINSFLANIKDQMFVLSECVDKVGPTEDAVKALLAHGLCITNHYRFSESEDYECSHAWDCRMIRLKLLQFKDRLETFVGINMGRFSVEEYRNFRIAPINEVAAYQAASGKIGALNLLFKRHLYSMAPFMLDILTAIPETVPVQTYGQLLPGRSPPPTTMLREKDWVECDKMVAFVNRFPDTERSIQDRTEHFVNLCLGFVWPSIDELSFWYKKRAREIDNFSGQLDNSICLVEFACSKGIVELQHFHEDISFLHHLVYSDESDEEINFSMSIVSWEQLSDYEKFKMMLKGVKDDKVLVRLREKAIPFMRNRFHDMALASEHQVKDYQHFIECKNDDSYLVRWLKETASENKLDICLAVIEEGCREFQIDRLFQNDMEAIECALQCLYLCTATDRWSTMASILLKLPLIQDTEMHVVNLEKRAKQAEGHLEVGRLLANYQVPKPMNFFLEAQLDEKGVKQILRLILSKFSRRHPGRSDNEWANMWRDMQCFQEKAFPFLDKEYMLMEFCRGLLKAGKFSLARNYLKGTSTVALAIEKAENLVIQAAREYFFSASSLAGSEIWKAKECLNILPNSKNVKAELDIIDALTVKLPNLGVTLLPVEFRQIRDPMDIIKMAITNQSGAYLNVDELIEIAKLLGLNSQDDISVVQEAIAREAAVAGDLQLAFDLCLVLAKKGHGLIWDLCAAIARGPALENMNINSRKELLGFAMIHCDEESIGEILHSWKDLDMQGQWEALMTATGSNPPNFSAQGSSIISLPAHNIQDIVNLRDCSELAGGISISDEEGHLEDIKNMLSTVVKGLPIQCGASLDSCLRENGKILSFAALQLPWLLELRGKPEHGKRTITETKTTIGRIHMSVRTLAVVSILSWLARNDFSPSDSLIVSLAQSIMEPPATEEEDILGCSFLLNLLDAFHGVEVIEEQLRTRDRYHEICSIMNIGMVYSALHNYNGECSCPAQRRELLLRKFQEKHAAVSSDAVNSIDQVQSTFWREWKFKLEEQKRVADQSRMLEQIVPGVETARFLSGDLDYIRSVLLCLVDSVKMEKKSILKDVMNLADTYGLNHTEVLLRYLISALVSEVWEDDDITAEISDYEEEIIAHAAEVINSISSVVYPAIDGHNKKRLAYIYSILSDCYLQLEGTEGPLLTAHYDPDCRLTQFYKVLEQECRRVSFIRDLNFKNIAGLDRLNYACLINEIYNNIDEYTVEPLAEMVQTLVNHNTDKVPEGLISRQDVYKHHVLSLVTALEARIKTDKHAENACNLQVLINELEQNYDLCRVYIRSMSQSNVMDIMRHYFMSILPLSVSFESSYSDLAWMNCLIMLLKFWTRLADDMQDIVSSSGSTEPIKFNPEDLSKCLKVLTKLVMEERVTAYEGWVTVIDYLNHGLNGSSSLEVFIFCRAMVFAGCGFGAIAELFSEALLLDPTSLTFGANNGGYPHSVLHLSSFYVKILDSVLLDLAGESSGHQKLQHLLSSLSKLEDNREDLKEVRSAVWERLIIFSDNMQLQREVRVYVLELMQFISGRNFGGVSAKFPSNVRPWEGWVELQCTTSNEITDHGGSNRTDTSSRFTSTLIALKSTQLAAAISPNVEVTPDDLLTIDSAVSCFLNLCRVAITKSNINALVSILGEWEGLFTSVRDEDDAVETYDTGNNWSSDEWDAGWESFQEEPVEKEKKGKNFHVDPLHKCWIEILKKFMVISQLTDVFKLIDQSLTKSNGILLDEDGAQILARLVLELDCFAALKIVLLLPYQEVQLECLDAVEAKLKREGVTDIMSGDHELFTLILSSGVLSTIMKTPSYRTTFLYLCYLVGHFSHLWQEALLSWHRHKRGGSVCDKNDVLVVFSRILFPYFVSELINSGQQILAGFLVTKFMRTHASLSLINVAEASLRRYLEGQVRILQTSEPAQEEMDLCMTLRNTISVLKGKLESRIQSALLSLSTTVK